MGEFNKARARLVLNHPFFATLALYLESIPTEDVDTAATDGRRLYYNPGWIKGLVSQYGLAAPEAIIAHEVLHCALCHLTRRGARDPRLWNYAADFAVNLVLEESGFKLPRGVLLDHRFKGMSAERIYEELLGEAKGGGGGGYAPNGELLDDHSLWGKNSAGNDGGSGADKKGSGGAMSPSAAKELEAEWKARVAAAAQAARTQGKCPAGLERLINELLEPHIPWREVLADFMERISNEYCWGPFDRRFTHSATYIPSRGQDGLNEIVLVCDTSGSVSQEELSQFVSEVKVIAEIGANTIHVVFCDADIGAWYTIELGEDFPMIKPTGGGGTDFRPVFRAVEEKGLSPSLLIYHTDGYGSFPERPPSYPVLWALTKYHREPPWGNKIIVEL